MCNVRLIHCNSAFNIDWILVFDVHMLHVQGVWGSDKRVANNACMLTFIKLICVMMRSLCCVVTVVR